MNYTISVDWLQTFCLGKPLTTEPVHADGFMFTAVRQDYQTAQFLAVYHIFEGKRQVATITQEPRTSVIDRFTTLVKLENRLLYTERYIEYLYAIQKAFNLIYKGITRLDLCLDCEELADGRKVDRFIKQYVTADAFQKGHIYRKGSNRFTLHGTRGITDAGRFSSIRFGTPNSKIGAYIYDKTLELIEVKDKPWIRDMWVKNGLCPQYKEEEYEELRNMTEAERKRKVEFYGLSDAVKNHIWRFEISIKAQGADILNFNTGELFRLSPRYIEHVESIEKLFFIYAKKVFSFFINDRGQKRTRDYSPLMLFDEKHPVTCKPIQISRNMDCGRSEKTCLNKLVKISKEYHEFAGAYTTHLSKVIEFLNTAASCKRWRYANQDNQRLLDGFLSSRWVASDIIDYLDAVKEFHQLRWSARYQPEFDYSEILYDVFRECSEYPPLPSEEDLKSYDFLGYMEPCQRYEDR